MLPVLVPVAAYNPISGGERHRWQMANSLASLGVDVYVPRASGGVPAGMALKQVEGERWDRLVRDGAVVVYTDIVPGNPYQAKRVVRWCMAPPGFVRNEQGGCWTPGDADTASPYPERVYLYHEMYRRYLPPAMQAEAKLLYWLHVEHELFHARDLPQKRGGFAFYFPGRPKWRDPVPAAVNLLPRMPKSTRPEFARWAREHEWMLCVDYNSFAMWECGLCGCYARLPQNSVFTRAEYEASPLGLVGVAMEAADIERAQEEVAPRPDGTNAVSDRYAQVEALCAAQLKSFAKDIQEDW